MQQQSLDAGLDFASPQRTVGLPEHLNDCPLDDSVAEAPLL
jgi:hypothetical protein